MPCESPRFVLYYAHDPMCSWCWGFEPALRELLATLPADVTVKRLLGGLAPDSDRPMPAALRACIRATWERIEQAIPGTEFNYDFWTHCQPRRSTYPACRAVIAARQQGPEYDERMSGAIQRAYYREARNPSDDDTLIELAGEIGLQTGAFARALAAPATDRELGAEIALARRLGVDSFPALVFVAGDRSRHVPVDYNDSGSMLVAIERLRESAG